MQTHWLAAGLWLFLGREAAAGATLAYLAGRLGKLSASDLAWLVTALAPAGLPVTHPLLVAAATSLEQSQAPDGRWPADDGPAWEVHTTLEALRALGLCGRRPAAAGVAGGG